MMRRRKAIIISIDFTVNVAGDRWRAACEATSAQLLLRHAGGMALKARRC